jgi:transposase-like protein
MLLSGAPQWIGGCHRGAAGRLSAHAVGSHARPNARSSVSLVDALLPGDILANEWPDQEYPNASRARSCRLGRRQTFGDCPLDARVPSDALTRLWFRNGRFGRFLSVGSSLFEVLYDALWKELVDRLFARPLARVLARSTHEGLLAVEMNLADLVEQFGSNDRCREYLEHLRWPEGVECPKCGSKSISRISTRKQFDCNSCRKRFSVMARTIFQDSKLPLWKWFAAVYLMCESKKGISALQLKRMLKIGSYETAWHLCHRIRSAMEGDGDLLDGIVEVDETFVGGKKRGIGSGNYQTTRSIVVGAAEREGEVRLRLVKDRRTQTLVGFVRDVVSDNVEAIYTDELDSYYPVSEIAPHETVTHSRKEYVRADVHTNTVEGVWSLFKRSVVGSYHQLSVKHLPAYLDEMEWRYNNRENPYLFRDTLLKLVESDALPYEELIQSL